MCHKTKVISSVKNGELSVCNGCKTYSLTYKNIFFQFEYDELIQFREYIARIDISYWLAYYAQTTQKRKIPIQTYHQNLILLFDIHEFEELSVLLKIKRRFKKDVLAPEDVDYTFILN